MMALIPIQAQIPAGSENTRQTLELDGVQVTITTKLLRNLGGWFLDIEDADGNAIAYGLRLTSGVDLFSAYKYNDATPPGALFVWWSATKEQQDPTELSFADGDAQIFYNEVGA